MRLQLLGAFVLVILLSVGINWGLAVRTTDSQFAVLVSEGNQRQAARLVSTLGTEYLKLGSWEAIQTEFDAQDNLERTWRREVNPVPNPRDLPALESVLQNLEINIGPRGNNIQGWTGRTRGMLNLNLPLWSEFAGQLESDAIHFLPSDAWKNSVEEFVTGNFVVEMPNESPILERITVLSPEASSNAEESYMIETNMLARMLLELRSGNQRAIVVDASGKVVLDSQKELLGKVVDNAFIKDGIALTNEGEPLATFVVTSIDGVYTVQQNVFLQQVREGLLYGGALSAGVALILGLVIAYGITRPILSLKAAVTRIQAGEWGYQVMDAGRNEIGQLSKAFNQMSKHLAEQRRLRARLVDDLAHELNTPLSLMRLELQAMRDGMQTPEEAAESLNQELDEVADLVADLIFLASRDAKRTPRMDWLDLNELVASSVRRFESGASPHVKLEFIPTPQLPALYGDPDLIQRAISNLISNALRHTSQGGSITLQTQQDGENLEVSVKDTGEGIPAEHLPYIFDRFYRVDDSRSRASGGRGLGLSIVKQIMDEHRGSVRVESKLNEGSTFTLVWSSAIVPS